MDLEYKVIMVLDGDNKTGPQRESFTVDSETYYMVRQLAVMGRVVKE